MAQAQEQGEDNEVVGACMTMCSLSFANLVGVLFIGLKLTGVIDWAWWWVLAPVWIPIVVIVVIGLLCLIIGSGRVLWERTND